MDSLGVGLEKKKKSLDQTVVLSSHLISGDGGGKEKWITWKTVYPGSREPESDAACRGILCLGVVLKS